MSWKWRYRDHPCHSQNLPQKLGKYYINELIFELIAATAVAVVQIGQSCTLPWHCSLPPGLTKEVAAKKNSTLTNLTSLDHSWGHTHRIIIISRTREFIKLFVIFTKSSVLFFLQYNLPVPSRWLPATLFFSDVNLRGLCHLKRNHNVGWGSIWSLSWRRTSVCFCPHAVAEDWREVGEAWSCEADYIYIKTQIKKVYWENLIELFV